MITPTVKASLTFQYKVFFVIAKPPSFISTSYTTAQMCSSFDEENLKKGKQFDRQLNGKFESNFDGNCEMKERKK